MSDINERIAKIKGWVHFPADRANNRWYDARDPDDCRFFFRCPDWEHSIADAWPLLTELREKRGYYPIIRELDHTTHVQLSTGRDDKYIDDSLTRAAMSALNRTELAICLAYLAVMENDNGK
jgi:hypothetical protein